MGDTGRIFYLGIIMKKVLCAIPNNDDATSFYRGVGPISELRKEMLDHEFVLLNNERITLAQLSMFDIVFMQRPFRPADKQLVTMCRDLKIPIWVDYDDDLFNVQDDNPAAMHYQKPAQEIVKFCLENSTVVSVSTAHLKKQLEKYNKNIHVVQNAINFRLFPMQKPSMRKICYWRGSASHAGDVMEYGDAIANPINAHSDWIFRFIGNNPVGATHKITHKDSSYMHPMPVTAYFKTLAKIKPSLCIVPLSDNIFNRSKSNIAYLEATISGAATFAPDWDEWKNPGCVRYRSAENFQEGFKEILSGRVNIRENILKAQQFVLANFNLISENSKRKMILKELS